MARNQIPLSSFLAQGLFASKKQGVLIIPKFPCNYGVSKMLIIYRLSFHFMQIVIIIVF